VLLKRWFHARNIIIVSPKGVKHVPVSVGIQCAALTVAVGFICWASYSTGSYVAARSALKAQTQTLRSVASAHVNSSFNPLSKTATGNAHLYRPALSLTASTDEMASRMAYLEHKVTQLQTANAEIIQRVHEKTADKIDDLEDIINKTGLDANKVIKSSQAETAKSQGGPYIPADMRALKKSTDALFTDLDELYKLRQIVNALPLGYPIRGAKNHSNYGHRYDPFTNRLAFHAGLDLAGARGSKIYSTADGVVAKAKRNRSYGNLIDIDHGNGITTRFAHLSKMLVRAGQAVKKGDLIGIQGSTGRSTGPHLHYEVHYKGRPMNPKNFLEVGRYVSQE